MKLFILVGIPGSGKSTRVKHILSKLSADVICPDDIRLEITGDASDQSKNSEVWDIAYQNLHASLTKGSNVIFDSTAVSKKARKRLLSIGKKYDCEIIAIVCNVSLKTAISRQSLRSRKVPNDIITRFHDRFETPTTAEGFDLVLVYD